MPAQKSGPPSCFSGLSGEHPCSFLSLLPSLSLAFWFGLCYFFCIFSCDGNYSAGLARARVTEVREALRGAHPMAAQAWSHKQRRAFPPPAGVMQESPSFSAGAD